MILSYKVQIYPCIASSTTLLLQQENEVGGRFKMAICPECDNLLDIDEDEVEEGETITCDECGTDLEIVSSDPLELAAVDAEGYDDEDDTHAHAADDEDDE